MPAKMDLDLAGAVFTDELHTDVGAAAFEIDHDFFTQEDLVIRTLGGGAGVLLTDGVDYQLSEEDTYLSANTSPAKTVYRNIQVINAAYQTGDLYFSGEYIADANEAADVNLPRLRGHLWGLTLSNNAVDADHDIDIAVGETISDDGDYVMVLGTALTKQLDVAWAEGTDDGGLDTGAIAASTTYHVYLIRKDILGTIDALFSLSATAPTMPTGWTAKRRIGAVITDVGENIIAFSQRGDEFLRSAPVAGSQAIGATTAYTLLAQVPTGIKVDAMIDATISAPTAANFGLITTMEQADTAPTVTLFSLFSTAAYANMFHGRLRTNINAQFRFRGSHASGTFLYTQHGWIDTRGRDA